MGIRGRQYENLLPGPLRVLANRIGFVAWWRDGWLGNLRVFGHDYQ